MTSERHVLSKGECLQGKRLWSNLPSASRTCGFSEQSSIRNETMPGVGASGRAAAIYSTDFLSKAFCDKSRNCKDFACEASIVSWDLMFQQDVPW